MTWIFAALGTAGVLMWALVRGAAKCRSCDTARGLDDEQARVLAQMCGNR